MKKNEWNEGLSNIDIDLVEEYVNKKEKLAGMKKRSASLLRTGAVAACLVVVMGVIVAVPMLRRGEQPKIPVGDKVHSSNSAEHMSDPVIESIDLPIVPKPLYPSNTEIITLSAEDAANSFGDKRTMGGTNNYTTVYKLSEGDLNISPIPDTDYLPIYHSIDELPPEEVLQNFIDRYKDSVSKYFNVYIGSYTIKTYESRLTIDSLEVRIPGSKGRFYFHASGNKLRFDYCSSRNERFSCENPISAYDTDDEIKAKLKNVISGICSTFGKNYSEIKIHRYCDKEQLKTVNVYLYTPENVVHSNGITTVPSSEYIKLTFNTDWGFGTSNHWGGSKDEAYLCDFTLTENINNSTYGYKIDGISKMLSLEEAEELLTKGYVFGGHSCPICMANQPLVDFTNYDFVEISYKTGSFNTGISIPFYSFYKYLGDNENGIKEYAVTYVPAVEVDGLDEYFEKEKATHRNFHDALSDLYKDVPLYKDFISE